MSTLDKWTNRTETTVDRDCLTGDPFSLFRKQPADQYLTSFAMTISFAIFIFFSTIAEALGSASGLKNTTRRGPKEADPEERKAFMGNTTLQQQRAIAALKICLSLAQLNGKDFPEKQHNGCIADKRRTK